MIRYFTLIILLMCSVFLSAQATDLIISEYVEGSSYNKAIEIFNGTGNAVDLSQYSLKKQVNGAGLFGNELILSGSLANNDVFVVVSNGSSGTTSHNLVGQPYVDLDTASGALSFNGNDAVGLYRNGTLIDVVGIANQVENWGQDMTLVRNSNVYMPTTTFSMTEWTQYPIDTLVNLGIHTFTGGSTTPVIVVTYPNTSLSWYLGQTYMITWSSANVDGNVNIGILNGETLSVIDGSAPNSGSYTFSVPETYQTGDTYRIRIAAVNGSTADTSDVFFSIMELPVTLVPTIAQLRMGTPDGTTIYRLTGEAILAYQQTYRNKKYFQDATGGIELDDVNGIITTTYQIGDAVANLTGTLTSYYNLLQFVPYANSNPAVSSGNEIVSPIVTVNELNTNFEAYESRLVYINNANFLDTTNPFATGTAYMVSDGTGQIAFRTNFYEADYIGQAIPSTPVNMRVITTQYDNTYQITARSLADFTPVLNDDDLMETPIVRMQVFPNPFSEQTSLRFMAAKTSASAINIYNAKGRLIRSLVPEVSKDGYLTVKWDSKDQDGNRVPAGIYLYHMKDGKYTSSGKMVLLK